MKKLSLLLLALASPARPRGQEELLVYRVGSASDVTAATTAGVVLMGGSTDVDAAFQWMCGLSGSGDFLIVRARAPTPTTLTSVSCARTEFGRDADHPVDRRRERPVRREHDCQTQRHSGSPAATSRTT